MNEIEKIEMQVKRAKEKLAQAKKKAQKQERKERDTALFTVGAVIFAALENSEEEKREQILNLWKYVATKYSPKITDYRRQCLDKHLPRGDL